MNLIKVFIAKLLTSSIIGRFIGGISGGIIKKHGCRFYVKSSEISPEIVASIFWGFYESAEIRFIKKHLRSDLSVIELGTSIGVISSISRLINKELLICIEANPDLIPIIKKNFEMNNISNYKIINAAIGSINKQRLYFLKGSNNISGIISETSSKDSIEIPIVRLSEIISKNFIHEYILISDIEGAEIFILENDEVALLNCKQIIIETHNTNLGNKEIASSTTINKIINLGFTIADQYGPNLVFIKD